MYLCTFPVHSPIKYAVLSKISFKQIDHHRVALKTNTSFRSSVYQIGSNLFGSVSKNGPVYIKDFILFLGSNIGFKKFISCFMLIYSMLEGDLGGYHL